MREITSRLIVFLLDRVTAPARAVAASIKSMGDAARHLQAVTGIASFTNGVTAALDRANGRLAAFHSRLLEVGASGYVLARSIASPVRAAMDFESAMADVRKVVDFASPEAFKAFQRDVLDMSTRLPMAATGLTKIVAAVRRRAPPVKGGRSAATSTRAAPIGSARRGARSSRPGGPGRSPRTAPAAAHHLAR